MTNYIEAILLFFGLFLLFKIIQTIIISRLEKLAKKTSTNFDDILVALIKGIKPHAYLFLAGFLAIKTLDFSLTTNHWINTIFVILVSWQLSRSIQLLSKIISEDEALGSDGSASAINSMGILIKIAVWIVAILVILSIWGVNITSIVAGLGIGGIAIAFALQNILQDIFSSFSIFIDKPFVVGDMIVVGTDTGTVERIGLKSTRIRTLQGEELVVSNKELTTARVHNFKKMTDRRVLFSLGVTYGTVPEKLKEIPGLIKNIIENTPEARFDRAHFKDYGDFSLNFEIVYYVSSSDYARYMDIQEKINLRIFEEFKTLGVEFAYPTQNVILQK